MKQFEDRGQGWLPVVEFVLPDGSRACVGGCPADDPAGVLLTRAFARAAVSAHQVEMNRSAT